MTEPYFAIDPTEKKRDAMLLAYCRVSTLEQAKSDRTSMKEQERVVRGYAMMKGIADFDTAIFSDPGVSGATPLDQRPAGEELLKAARPGDIICASKLDRMFRSALDALKMSEKFKKQGIDLVLLDMGDQPVTSNGLSTCFFTMAAAFAQLERVRIAERMADGRRAKAERGGCIGSVPYGFNKVGKGRQAVLEPNLEEQDTMQKILKWSRNMAPSQIVRRLTKEGIKPRCPRPPLTNLPYRPRTASGHYVQKGRWQEIQIIRIRRHARRLWPDLIGTSGAKTLKKYHKPPKEITHSEDGMHTTLWM